MTDASKILDKILPEKSVFNGYNDIGIAPNIGWNNARQRLLSTYGKEWVGVDVIKDIIDTVHLHSLKELHGDYRLVNDGELEQALERAESILKGLRGK